VGPQPAAAVAEERMFYVLVCPIYRGTLENLAE
jgi:hypothetical protein